MAPFGQQGAVGLVERGFDGALYSGMAERKQSACVHKSAKVAGKLGGCDARALRPARAWQVGGVGRQDAVKFDNEAKEPEHGQLDVVDLVHKLREHACRWNWKLAQF